MVYNQQAYANIDHMGRLIREQKIERRIMQQQRDLYTTTSRSGGGRAATLKITPSLRAVGISDQMIIRSTARGVPFRAVRDRRPSRLLDRFRAMADRIIETATNTDLCFVASVFIAIVALSMVLQPDGAIVNHTFQPAVFRLPQIEAGTGGGGGGGLSVYINSQEVEAPLVEYDPDDFSTFQAQTHVVKNGQTISELAGLHNVSMSTLISFNQIGNARSLQAGSDYSVPDREGILHTVKSNETIEQIAERHVLSVNELLDVNDLASASLESGQELFIPGAALGDFDLRLALGELFARPVSGRISSRFGYRSDPFSGVRRFHYGLDIAASTGVPVLASMEGTVSYIGDQSRGYGKYIILRHPGGFQSLYAHLNGFNIRTGQSISRGQTIGWVGNTGRSTGSHLHFAIIRNGKFVSPVSYLY